MLLPASQPSSATTASDGGGGGDGGRGGGAYGSAYGSGGYGSGKAGKGEYREDAGDAHGKWGEAARGGARGWLWSRVEAVLAAVERFYERWRQPLVVWILIGCELAVIAMITTAVRSNGLKRKNHHQHHHFSPAH